MPLEQERSGEGCCPACGFQPPHAIQEDQKSQTAEPGISPPTIAPSAYGTNDEASTVPPLPAHGYYSTTIVPNYEILEELGQGGLGVVYRARHLHLKRIVALKMIRAGIHAQVEDRIRFRTEAEAVARLEHPNVVQIYEIGEYGGLPFLAFELCSGGSLDKKLNGNPMAPREAAELLEKLAHAMHVAHRAQVVHRDLKPANILLSADGQPKVSDFGMAKLQDEQGLTQTGAVFGTPSYMAPEQASGQVKTIGPAGDIYSLGTILYECLTGQPPFLGKTVLETLEQVKTQNPIPPRELNSAIPPDLASICLKCLSRIPADRYASAEELSEDLHCFLSGKPVRSRRWRAGRETWRKLKRYRGGILSMTCATAVVILFFASLLGLLSSGAYPVDSARPDLWITSPGCRSIELGDPLPVTWVSRLRARRDVVQTEPYIVQHAYWRLAGRRELCCIIGCDLGEASMGAPYQLSPDLRTLLRQPGTVVVSESDLPRLGIRGLGDVAVIGRSDVRVIGLLTGKYGISSSYVICSLGTAREVLKMDASETTFVLAKCGDVKQVEETKQDLLEKFGEISTFSAAEFSTRTRMYTLTRTPNGILWSSFIVILGLLAVFPISGTLHAVNQESIREKRRTRRGMVIWFRLTVATLLRSVFVTLTGSILAIPVGLALAHALKRLGVVAMVPWWLSVGAMVLSLFVALFAALLAAIRAVWLTIPET
jgi:serine/threonine protein kinase